MKPTPQIPQPKTSRHDAGARRTRITAPRIDCAYRPNSIDDYSSRGRNGIKFRDLSDGYFEKEAPRAFATEAAVFGAIVLTVIVPLAHSASAMFQLVRSTGL